MDSDNKNIFYPEDLPIHNLTLFIIKYDTRILGVSDNLTGAKEYLESYTSKITADLTSSNNFSLIELEDEDSDGENYCFQRNIFGVARANFVNMTPSLIDTLEIQKTNFI